jgi:hypothetical protein
MLATAPRTPVTARGASALTETPGAAPAGGPVSDRMQALLSRAVEEQVSEQRAVSTLLSEIRGQLAALSDGFRGTASDAGLERVGGAVDTVVADLRTSTSLLGQRIDALAKRVEAVAADATAPTEHAAVRLTALSAEIGAQAQAVERMQGALDQLSAFPSALAALQKDVAGLHDRLAPLAEVRSGLGDLSARTAGSLDALGPALEALRGSVAAFGPVPDPDRLRDAVVDALTGRLDALTETAARPVLGPEALTSSLGELRADLGTATGERFDQVAAALAAVESRLGQVGQRLSEVGDAAGGVPALSTDLTRLAGRVEELHALREQVGRLTLGVDALREDGTGTALTLGLAALRDDVEQLAERVEQTAPRPTDEIATLVSQRVADLLVETLAPRIADLVLNRVGATLVNQLGDALAPRLADDTEVLVRSVTADSERRVLAHVDEAVLALAEALLRRRRGGRPMTLPAPGAGHEAVHQPSELVPEVVPELLEVAVGAPEQPAPAEREPEPSVQDVIDTLNALPEVPAAVEAVAEPETPAEPQAAVQPPRPAVTSSLAPARAPAPTTAPVEAAAPVEAEPPAARLLEPTPDLPLDSEEPPVGGGGPGGRAQGRTRPRPQPQAQPTPTAPAREAAAAAPSPPAKRKPWWRPGG